MLAKKISLPWGSTIKEEFNHPRYGRVYNCKYSIILGSWKNYIIINFLNDGTDNVEYECINLTIVDGNLMYISLIVIQGEYGAIDYDSSTCYGYYIIIFYSPPYNLQVHLNIYGQVPSNNI